MFDWLFPDRDIRTKNPGAKLIRIGGAEVFMDDRNATDLVAVRAEGGSFERPLPDLIVGASRHFGGTFLDVGANSGLYSLLACAANRHTRSIAFEPFGAASEAMRKNLALNHPCLARRIEIRMSALSDKTGEATIYVPPPTAELLETSASLEADFKRGSIGGPVRTARLDDEPIYGKIRIAKVDIEGHEHKFLAGAEHTISAHRPIVFLEIVRAANVEEIGAFFNRLGYANFELNQRTRGVTRVTQVAKNRAAWNHAFVPDDMLATFLSICREAQCPAN